MREVGATGSAQRHRFWRPLRLSDASTRRFVKWFLHDTFPNRNLQIYRSAAIRLADIPRDGEAERWLKSIIDAPPTYMALFTSEAESREADLGRPALLCPPESDSTASPTPRYVGNVEIEIVDKQIEHFAQHGIFVRTSWITLACEDERVTFPFFQVINDDGGRPLSVDEIQELQRWFEAGPAKSNHRFAPSMERAGIPESPMLLTPGALRQAALWAATAEMRTGSTGSVRHIVDDLGAANLPLNLEPDEVQALEDIAQNIRIDSQAIRNSEQVLLSDSEETWMWDSEGTWWWYPEEDTESIRSQGPYGKHHA
ncbi:hypothetical protein [Pandoraea terrae]|nr:hypothetical protein [Pandoraea terrae]